jgi:hypothetical protein
MCGHIRYFHHCVPFTYTPFWMRISRVVSMGDFTKTIFIGARTHTNLGTLLVVLQFRNYTNVMKMSTTLLVTMCVSDVVTGLTTEKCPAKLTVVWFIVPCEDSKCAPKIRRNVHLQQAPKQNTLTLKMDVASKRETWTKAYYSVRYANSKNSLQKDWKNYTAITWEIACINFYLSVLKIIILWLLVT